MTYTYNLLVIDEDGNSIVDHPLTADQAVTILADALKNPPIGNAEEEIEEAPEPVNQSSRAGDEKRHAKILKLLERGMKPREIADKLGCSYQTVYNAKARGKITSTTKAKGGCPECGSGGRHRKGCSRAGLAKSFQPEASVPEPESKKLTEEQYNDLHFVMLDKDFMSGQYALTEKLSPREVNAALKASSFEEYLAS